VNCSGAAAIANQFAAMPSLHMAWAVWCAATVFTLASHRWLRVLAVAYPVLTALVVLGTENHSLFDVVAVGTCMGRGRRGDDRRRGDRRSTGSGPGPRVRSGHYAVSAAP
jgi:hypothetical protein